MAAGGEHARCQPRPLVSRQWCSSRPLSILRRLGKEPRRAVIVIRPYCTSVVYEVDIDIHQTGCPAGKEHRQRARPARPGSGSPLTTHDMTNSKSRCSQMWIPVPGAYSETKTKRPKPGRRANFSKVKGKKQSVTGKFSETHLAKSRKEAGGRRGKGWDRSRQTTRFRDRDHRQIGADRTC